MSNIDEKIYELLRKPQRADELSRQLPYVPRRVIAQVLEEMQQDGRILRNKKNKYGYPSAFGCVIGTFLATERAFSFVATPESTIDIFIPPRKDNGAWHGDTVLVKISEYARDASKPEGTVLKIVKRSQKDIVGTVQKRGRTFFIEPDISKYPRIELVKNKLNGAEVGHKVAVKPVFWGDNKKRLSPQAIVTAVLGRSGYMESSIAGVLHENNVIGEFPIDVIKQAESFGDTVKTENLKNREDLRSKCIFTIDGDSAKDFDDALSIEQMENGHVLVGVHIADVSHYVTEGSPLDKEAFQRGTSVYYPGNVVPMLPFALSNGLCSLNPDVDRYAFSAFLEFDKDGRRYKSRFTKSIIRSCARMTYNKVNLALAGDTTIYGKQLTQTLEELNKLAKTRRKRRFERGALDLDLPEAEVVVDETGHAIDIRNRERGDSERLIEEFMLSANEAVAEHMEKRDIPTVYRIHENPDSEKLASFGSFARNFGYRVDASKPEDTAQLQAVLKGAKGKPEQKILPVMLLRSLARAKYSNECLGHYGLQAKFYLHFTSPIRRYPDLIAHRMLHKHLIGKTITNSDDVMCEEAATQSTIREQAADNCERSITKLYIADYMSQFVGQTFEGTVSGVTSFGLFVELENGAEGLLRIEDLSGYWKFDDKHLAFTSKSGVRISIGTSMKVLLVAASNVTGQIDFMPVSDKS